MSKVNIQKAPDYVRELLQDEGLTTKIAVNFPEIEKVILEAQRNITSLPDNCDESAMIRGIAHLLKHFRLFRDVGNEIIEEREKATPRQEEQTK